MANPEHLVELRYGSRLWNEWREKHNSVIPDLKGADLSEGIFFGADLSSADLERANLRGVDLRGVNFRRANLNHADLHGSNIHGADFSDASLVGTDLSDSNTCLSFELHISHGLVMWADTHFFGTTLRRTTLNGMDCGNAAFGDTVFAQLDLSSTHNLPHAKHRRPSFIDVDTIYRSRGVLHETFLRGCGVPESFIANQKRLVDLMAP